MKIVTDTKEMADGFKIGHKGLKKLLERHREVFESWGEIIKEEQLGTGHPCLVYKLNDTQATLLTLLLGNTPEVVQFKSKIIRELRL